MEKINSMLGWEVFLYVYLQKQLSLTIRMQIWVIQGLLVGSCNLHFCVFKAPRHFSATASLDVSYILQLGSVSSHFL